MARCITVGLAAAAFAAAPVAAQDRDADSDIIVLGERAVSVGKLRQQARSITPLPGSWNEPMPRFHAPICAGVLGMSVESAQLVIDRIYYNAEQIGLPLVREPGCDPNVIVALPEDAAAEFQAMRDERHPLLRGLDLWDRKRVDRQENPPVLAWNVISTFTANGAVPLGNPPVAEATNISRTTTSTTNRILISIIMIDQAAVAGMDAVTLADYVTMRALAHTRAPVDPVAVDTILTLFAGTDNPPDRLSVFDRAYLAGIYDSPDNRPVHMAMGTIGRRLERELAQED